LVISIWSLDGVGEQCFFYVLFTLNKNLSLYAWGKGYLFQNVLFSWSNHLSESLVGSSIMFHIKLGIVYRFLNLDHYTKYRRNLLAWMQPSFFFWRNGRERNRSWSLPFKYRNLSRCRNTRTNSSNSEDPEFGE